MNVYCLHNNTGSRYYRVLPQLKHLQDKGHKVIMEAHDEKHIKEHIEWADIVIFEMVWSIHWTKYAKKLGKRIIFDIDDLIHVVPKHHYSHKDIKGLKGWLWLWTIYRCLRLSDVLFVTSKPLKRTYGWMSKKCVIFENHLDLSHWLKERKENTTDKVRILWAGSKSHENDLKVFAPVMKRVMEARPQAQFLYVGTGGTKSKDKWAEFVYSPDMFPELPDNREFLLPVPANVWAYTLASIQADIAVAPLIKDRFNKHKSQCKFLEYAINHIPVVASEWFYKDIKHGETGFLAKTEDDWFTHLTTLIDSAELRQRIGENAYRYALTRDIRNYLNAWVREAIPSHESSKIKRKN